MNIFAARNWSRYSRQFANDRLELYKYKRIILLSQFALVGSVIGVLHALEDLVDGLLFMPMMDFIMASVIFVCYLLNENGLHRAAKLVLLGFLNIFFFVYSSLADKELGIFLYYFPWIGLAAVIFEPKEKAERIFFIVLSVILLVALFSTKFDAFGPTPFLAVDIGKSFIINMVSSIVVLVFFISFMIRMNVETEARLFDLAEEVRVKNETLEKTNRELDRFLYSASHDLRSPLMSIKGLVDIIYNEATDTKLKEYMKMMNGRIDKLDSFIQDIIDYSRNEKTEIKREPVDISSLIGEVLRNFQYLEGASSIEMEQSILIKEPVMLDKSRVTVVLNNLISNAIKYHTKLKGSFIRIEAKQEGDNLIISIADNGQGIDPAHIDKIFDMFYRASNQSKGSGLGLYIVKEALDKLQGAITVESEFHKGTTFTVTIPITK
jgi:signal transduction histidine kinase